MEYDPRWSVAAHAAAPSRAQLFAARPPEPSVFAEDLPDLTPPERALMVAAGLILAFWGVRRAGVSGAILASAGAATAACGVTGRDPVVRRMTPPAWRELAVEQGWRRAAVVSRAETIARPREEVYACWRDFANLPKFMENIEDVEVVDDRLSRWTVSGPGGTSLSWETEVTEDVPDARIAWRTLPGADVKSTGWVEFADAPGGRGTEVRALIAYEPPGGLMGRVAAKLMQREPQIQARRDLRRFKQLLEAGEIATAEPPRAAPRAS